MCLIFLMVLLVGLWPGPLLAGDPVLPPCSMQTDRLEIHLPSRGFTWLPTENLSGRCADLPAKSWIRKRSGSLDLFVYADGPSGSGRYWNVTVGVAERQQSKPTHGVCLMTSTVGWRTLQQYERIPLPWLDDLDRDGSSELIIWDRFPLREEASLAEYSLVAWVYRLRSHDLLTINWDLSRRMARELAQAYRAPLDSTKLQPKVMPRAKRFYIPVNLGMLRAEAAKSLEQFADERCSMLQNDSR
jgi:hypothetical protein